MSRYQLVQAKAGPELRAELRIYGDIGDWWDEESPDARSVVAELDQLAGDVDVRINSFGGSVADGVAIYNALSRYSRGRVTTHIDGVAYSIASLIAMAGQRVVAASNSMLMIHAPWIRISGNAVELRQAAEMLEKNASAMLSSYTRRAGVDAAQISAWLTDGADHYLTAAEALQAGLIDAVSGSIELDTRMAASLRETAYRIPAAMSAAPVPTPSPEATMPTQSTPAAIVAAESPAVETVVSLDPEQHLQAGRRAEADRRAKVKAVFDAFRSSDHAIAALAERCADDMNCGEEEARRQLLATLAERSQSSGPVLAPEQYAPTARAASAPPQTSAHIGGIGHIQAGLDSSEKRTGAIVDALQVRAGSADADTRRRVDGSNPWRGSTLLDLARESITRAGHRVGGMLPQQVVAIALTQGTSDFPVLLENTMHKVLQQAYATQPDTWSLFCAIGSVSDFRAHHRYRLGSLGDLDTVNELGEFANKAIPDGEKASISAITKGNLINMSRQAIINDDLGAFVGAATMLGRAARRSIENDVYNLLKLNSGLGPTQADTQPLFHSNRANVGTSAANSTAAWDEATAIMASQRDISGNDYLDLTPAVWVGPIGLRAAAIKVNDAEFDEESNKGNRRPNTARGMVQRIAATPRLSGNRYYFFADPNIAPVIEVAFLQGVQEPYLERQDGFSTDGVVYKVRIDYGVAVIDYRGAVTNAGG